MKSFRLEILSPERAFYVGDALSIRVPISDGLIGIMADHLPLTAAIEDGELTFTKADSSETVCAVTRGILDVTGGRVRILCESALLPGEIDEEKERREAEEAAGRLREKRSAKDYMIAQLTIARALNNLKVKQHNAVKSDNNR